MPTRRQPAFKKTDVTRALIAAKDAGFEIAITEIKPDGTIRLICGPAQNNSSLSPFDEWKQRHAN